MGHRLARHDAQVRLPRPRPCPLLLPLAAIPVCVLLQPLAGRSICLAVARTLPLPLRPLLLDLRCVQHARNALRDAFIFNPPPRSGGEIGSSTQKPTPISFFHTHVREPATAYIRFRPIPFAHRAFRTLVRHLGWMYAGGNSCWWTVVPVRGVCREKASASQMGLPPEIRAPRLSSGFG